MHAEGGSSIATTPTRPNTQARILEAANELFYASGIRATSADRIIEHVGITKVTFYRHFRTKSDLVVAYLEGQADTERRWMNSVTVVDDPRGTLRELAGGIGAASCMPGFRGCAFINAAAEFADPDDPVRRVVDEHRHWMRDYFEKVASSAGASAPASVADQFLIIRDGAMVGGYLCESGTLGVTLEGAFLAVVDASLLAPVPRGEVRQDREVSRRVD